VTDGQTDGIAVANTALAMRVLYKRAELSHFGVYASLGGISPPYNKNPGYAPDSRLSGYRRSAVRTPGLERQYTDGKQDSTCVCDAYNVECSYDRRLLFDHTICLVAGEHVFCGC